MQVSEKNMKNSEWLGRQAQRRIEPGTSHLLILARKSSAIDGAKDGEFDVHALPGI